MRPGTIIADRYEIVQLAGLGGMAEVYCGYDRRDSRSVALKILLDGQSDDDVRFEREIAALESLEHPGIVRILDHGILSFGARYFAMEWLEGEDLEHALMRGPLSIGQTLVLGRHIAEALAAAHARGVVHRDLKPANIFLVGGLPEKPKIVDFGIAKLTLRSRITSAGALMGTPGYIAPEQIRSEMDVDARADVFALGCLLYQCLTGKSAFPGDGIQAVLAKILFAEPLPLREYLPHVPLPLHHFVMRLLAKDPNARPNDGAAVVALFDELEALEMDSSAATMQTIASLTTTERRPVGILLIGAAPHVSADDAAMVAEMDRAIQSRASIAGIPCERLPDGSSALWISGTSVATDLAARAARMALMFRGHAPTRPFALTVGWGSLSEKNYSDDAVDRAVRTLAASLVEPETSAGRIVLDELTAGLLAGRFDVRETSRNTYVLHGERSTLAGARTLLGKPTACVGRERELRLLDDLLAQCIDEGISQAALVTSLPGLGKSRLAHEFVHQSRERYADLSLWIVAADVLRAGSALDLASRILSVPMAIAAMDSIDVRRQKLEARVAAHVDAGETRRVSRFLGEIVNAPFPDDDDLQLKSARASVQLMLDQLRTAFVDFLSAECGAAPVLLVIEDLQWGDLPSIRLLDAALREIKDHPFFILALARPEIHERFPKLWSGRRFHSVVLSELSRKSSERLVRQTLGAQAQEALVERILARAQGNPFYMEELVRAAAEGRDDEFPETVVAMVQSRLHSLEDIERRILRAASIFGDVFWAEAVHALLGNGESSTTIREKLQKLVEREILSLRPESRFSGEDEHAFRHALLREGAFAMLTPEDRALGHALAGDWLERHGETDPLVLAGHFALGGKNERAASHYFRAAERAHRAGDDEVAIRRAERGLSLEPDPATYIGLLGILTETRMWRNQLDEASVSGAKLTRVAPPGSSPWVRGALAQFTYAMRHGHVEEALGLLDVIRSIDPAPEVLSTLALALAMASVILLTEGRVDLVEPMHKRLEAIVGPMADRDPMARAYWHLAYPRWEAWILENPWQSLLRARAAHDAFAEAGSRRGQLLARVFIGMNEWLLGQSARAAETLCADVRLEEDFAIVASLRSLFRVLALLDSGDSRSARTEAEQLIAMAQSKGTNTDVGRGRWALAEVYRRAGVYGLAEREARCAVDLRGIAPLDEAAALAILAATRLSDKRPTEAMLAIRDSAARYEALRAFGYRGAFMRLVRVEVFDATGHHGAAREFLADARDRILRIAAEIPDESWRKSYLEQVPENARTIHLAEEWFGKTDV